MGKFIDLTGQKFGRLIVLEYIGDSKWKCQCECGKIKIVLGSRLKTGNTKSCGCLRSENGKRTMQLEEVRKSTKKHGMSNSKIYRTWRHILDRCTRQTNSSYRDYGARGIKICREWQDDFMNFYNWAMANGYKDDLSIDRIDNNKGYSPDNCRWATMKEQQNNKRNNQYITYKNKTKTISQWAEILDINRSTIMSRLRRGWSFTKTINTPIKITHKNQNKENKTIKNYDISADEVQILTPKKQDNQNNDLSMDEQII